MRYERVWRKNLKYRHFRPKSPSFALHRTAGLCTWPWLSKRLLLRVCRVACVAGIKRGRGRGNLGFPLLKPATQATCRAIFVLFIFFFKLLCVHNCPLNPIWKVILNITRGFLVLTAKVLIQFIINTLRIHSSPMFAFSATSTNIWLVKKIFTRTLSIRTILETSVSKMRCGRSIFSSRGSLVWR